MTNNDHLEKIKKLAADLKALREAGESLDVDAVRRRLEKVGLVRGGDAPRPAGTDSPVVYSRDMPRGVGPLKAARRRRGDFLRLEDVVPGRHQPAPAGPGFYLVERPAGDMARHAEAIPRRFSRMAADLARGEATEGTRNAPLLDELTAVARAWPGRLKFLDIETTGLGISPLFLVGLLCVQGSGPRTAWNSLPGQVSQGHASRSREHGPEAHATGGGAHELVIRQLLARNYAEEASVLSYLAELLVDSDVLVTFNGKTFDLPYIRVRCAATGVRFRERFRHVDLLHPARRLYRHRLPNCRLQTLEEYICRLPRTPDIPGHEIPAAYHEFVRTGNACEMVDIIRHNAIDLITMAHLVLAMAREHRNL